MKKPAMSRIRNISNKSNFVCGLALLAWLGSTQAGGASVLYAFAGRNDGYVPASDLIADGAGNLYGTTGWGGREGCHDRGRGCGTVFKLTPPTLGRGTWTETILYAFKGGSDGKFPRAGLIMDSAGSLYGTAYAGGAGYGVVFKLASNGTETVLHNFAGGNDGSTPQAGLIADNSGNLYGTTFVGGGTGCGGSGCGTVFKLAPDGSETVLHAFSGGTDGELPVAGLIADNADNFYGTTLGGGTQNGGTVFKLAADGAERVLYSFCSKSNCSDGEAPEAALIEDKTGNLYGTTATGAGGACIAGCGTVFKLAPDGTETVIHAFSEDRDGGYPLGGVIADNAGNLYGTTEIGGYEIPTDFCPAGCGTVFTLAPNGVETLLLHFTAASGAYPQAGLLLNNGHLFGAAASYGADRRGTVFQVVQ